MRTRIAVMHGVNLDMLERRPSDVYGELSFPQLERQIGKFAQEIGLETRFFQSNFEGEFVEVEDHRIEVIDMDGHRIDKVTIIPPHGDGGSIDVASEDS